MSIPLVVKLGSLILLPLGLGGHDKRSFKLSSRHQWNLDLGELLEFLAKKTVLAP